MRSFAFGSLTLIFALGLIACAEQKSAADNPDTQVGDEVQLQGTEPEDTEAVNGSVDSSSETDDPASAEVPASELPPSEPVTAPSEEATEAEPSEEPVAEPLSSSEAEPTPSASADSDTGGIGGNTSLDAGSPIASTGGTTGIDTGGTSGSSDAGSDDVDIDGVVLRAVITQNLASGSPGIAAEWTNGTDQSIFLRGCATTDGWYFDGTEWQEYGAFALCAAETPMKEVTPGETYLDLMGVGTPPQRGTGLWRVVGPYGVGCTPPGSLFSQAECETITELQSINEVAFTP